MRSLGQQSAANYAHGKPSLRLDRQACCSEDEPERASRPISSAHAHERNDARSASLRSAGHAAQPLNLAGVEDAVELCSRCRRPIAALTCSKSTADAEVRSPLHDAGLLGRNAGRSSRAPGSERGREWLAAHESAY